MHNLTANPDLRYLDAELMRIDILIRREVRRWMLAGQDPNDEYRGLYVAHAEAEALLERPLGVSWGQSSELPVEEAELLQKAVVEAERQSAAIRKRHAKEATPLRLERLAHDFDLARTDVDILLLCIAPAFDAKYERLYGYLQDNVTHRRPSVRLVLDLLGSPGMDRYALAAHLTPGAPLFRHRLLEPVIEPLPASSHWINQTLHPDEGVVAWLRGQYQPHPVLGQHAVLVEAGPNSADRLLVGDCVRRLNLDGCEGDTPIVVLYGADTARQDAAACMIAQHFGRSLLRINVEAAAAGQNSSAEVVRTSLRDAWMLGAVVHLRHWDFCVDEDRYAPPDLFAAICAHPGVVILSSAAAWRTGGIDRTRAVRACEFGVLDYSQRKLLWEHYLRGVRHESLTGTITGTIEALAGQFALTSDRIRDAAAAAKDAAQGSALTAEHLFAAARAYSSPRLSAAAHRINPRFDWGDLVLPEGQLEILLELAAAVRHRPKVLEQWGVGRKLVSSSGITALFAGPPGTGKTMAAEMLAGMLDLDLYKIDLASVVSKYIGETEKNLERIFSEASRSNAILFFDEADAIFGKRSEVKDAHDRYANLEISYLLQRMESYDGITILATNLRANLDEAFTRRLQFVVEFPFPQVQERQRIWTQLFPPELPRAQDIDFDLLAQRYELAGGNIRNIIVSAAYLAADNGNLVTMEHLLHGARRELQKMGRTISTADQR